MKYIIDVPEDMIIKSALSGLTLGIPMLVSATQKGYVLPTNIQLNQYTEPDRKAIEDEVWKIARLIALEVGDGGLSPDDLYECYKSSNIQEVMKIHSYQEAKAKYDKWEKEKEQIRVGDEVTLYDNVKLVVVTIDGTSAQGIDENGECYESIFLNELTKTGRHFDEVEELLKKMREE